MPPPTPPPLAKSPFLGNALVGLLFATALSYRGLRKQSLSRSGAVAAWVVGFLTMAASLRFGIVMILFYQSSSMLTKYRSEAKARFEEDHKEGGQRSAAQVLACSLLGTVVAAAHAWWLGPDDASLNFATAPLRSQLLCAFVGHYACCNGDTWASEIGILSPSSPRLVTALFREVVPRGTNGGMSWTGTCASVAGGAFIGAGHTVAGVLLGVPDEAAASGGGWLPAWLYMTVLGALCGFLGSLCDSVVGGLLQATWYCGERKTVVKNPTSKEQKGKSIRLISGADVLTNEQVNVLSVLVTTAVAPVLGQWLWSIGK